MKKTLAILGTLAGLVFATGAIAGDVEFVSTGEGDRSVGNEVPSVSDPYEGKKVTPRDDAGHPLTQKSYEDCEGEDRCIRAKKRQLSETTDWKDDRKSGLHKTSKPAPADTSATSADAPAKTE